MKQNLSKKKKNRLTNKTDYYNSSQTKENAKWNQLNQIKENKNWFETSFIQRGTK